MFVFVNPGSFFPESPLSNPVLFFFQSTLSSKSSGFSISFSTMLTLSCSSLSRTLSSPFLPVDNSIKTVDICRYRGRKLG
jgi:hypothetical protein